MKMLAVVGVLAVALGVSLAAEKKVDRSPTAAKKSNRPAGRLEFIARPSASREQSDSPVDPAGDLVAEELSADVSATPKRFTRTKAEATLGDHSPTASTRAALKPAKSVATTAAKLDEAVEFLPPPESDAEEEAQAPRKLMAKKPGSGIQPAGFNAEPTAKLKSKVSAVDETSHDDSTKGVVAADFQQNPGDKTRVRPASAEQHPAPSAATAQRPAVLKPAAKTSRISIVNEHSSRGTTTSDRAAHSKTSPTSGSPSVSVEWVKHGEINVGQECSCDLVVKNSGKVPAREVVVDATFPASVRLTRTIPEPAVVADHLEWSIPELAAGEERTIQISMVPSQRGELATTANVRFTGTAASVFKVEEPLLKVTTEAPAEVIVGDPLLQTVTLTNPGTGIAQHVKIQITAPDGLEATRGDRSTIEIGSLNPGESRTVRLSFNAIAGGEQTLAVEATADSGLSGTAEATVNVIAPSLTLTVEGPGLRYAGRDARYTLSITNDGQAATNNIRITHRVPKGFKFVKADKGGTFDANTSSVSWLVGHLEPQQSAQVKLNLQPTELGQFEHHAFATAEHGVTAKADAITKVEGSASLVLEIQDLDDPVEVGEETAYEVRISNTGSKAALNVGLTFEMPSGIELLNVQSATQHLAKNGLILFNDLPELAPGKTALFRIHVRGSAEGNQRVRARLTSESIEQELITEELTKFYAE
jgi:uncharacterized repeat protein (TIGR01451 family)